jgi:hypothetical protein
MDTADNNNNKIDVKKYPQLAAVLKKHGEGYDTFLNGDGVSCIKGMEDLPMLYKTQKHVERIIKAIEMDVSVNLDVIVGQVAANLKS